MRVYGSPAEGLLDAMRLAEGMTHKWAALEFDNGGGKAVLAVPQLLEGEERLGLLRRFGALMNTLGGTFATGRDLGTTDDDMLTLAEVTPYVHGVNVAGEAVKDPGPYTARGVFAAMRAVLHALHGEADPSGRVVVVQGAGAVGAPLAGRLAAAGARVLVSDVDTSKAESLAREVGAQTISAESVFDSECDIFAPCAVGAVLDEGTIARLRCRAVAGAANNQLAAEGDADRLHQRGILYAPDFVANGGGALAFGLMHRGVTDDRMLFDRLAGIEDSMRRILSEAAEQGESPLRAARRLVGRVLADKRAC